MSDLADQIDDYICTFDGVGDLTMDTLAMFIFGWALLFLFLLWLCKFLYNKYVKKDGGKDGAPVETNKFGLSPSEKIRRSESKELSASKDIRVNIHSSQIPNGNFLSSLWLLPKLLSQIFLNSLLRYVLISKCPWIWIYVQILKAEH